MCRDTGRSPELSPAHTHNRFHTPERCTSPLFAAPQDSCLRLRAPDKWRFFLCRLRVRNLPVNGIRRDQNIRSSPETRMLFFLHQTHTLARMPDTSPDPKKTRISLPHRDNRAWEIRTQSRIDIHILRSYRRLFYRSDAGELRDPRLFFVHIAAAVDSHSDPYRIVLNRHGRNQAVAKRTPGMAARQGAAAQQPAPERIPAESSSGTICPARQTRGHQPTRM